MHTVYIKTSKITQRPSYIKTVSKTRKNYVVRTSKTPQEIKDMIKAELAKANDVCCDMNKSDIDCMLQWDIVDDLSFAYRRAVEEEKRKQDMLSEKVDKDFIWNTRKKTFDV